MSLWCCFAPPSGRNLQGQFRSILVDFSLSSPGQLTILAEIITKEFPETIIFVIFLWSFSSFF